MYGLLTQYIGDYGDCFASLRPNGSYPCVCPFFIASQYSYLGSCCCSSQCERLAQNPCGTCNNHYLACQRKLLNSIHYTRIRSILLFNRSILVKNELNLPTFLTNIYENVVAISRVKKRKTTRLQKISNFILRYRFKAILLHPQHWKGLCLEK